jgi:lipoprotein NlpD
MYKLVFFIVIASFLNACTPAKYTGWSGGNQYFKDNTNQQNTKASASKNNSKANNKQDCSNLYVVKPGDTLSQIAEKCQLKQATIIQINQLSPPYWLAVKQELRLVASDSVAFKTEKITYPKNRFIWPVKNKNNYQFKRDINGRTALVIKQPQGTGVYAVSAGEVAYSGDGIRQFGNMVIIKHDNGYLTLYAHNHRNKVKEGQKVKRNQLIATVGKTGSVTEPQLYFEVRYKGKKIDAKSRFK